MYAIYLLNNKHLAVDTQFIKGISKKESIYPLPNAPDFLVGITNIKGELYSIIDIFNVKYSSSTVSTFNYVIRIKPPHNFLLTAATKPVLIENTGEILKIEPEQDIDIFTKEIFYYEKNLVHLLDIIHLDNVLKNIHSGSDVNKEEK